VKIKKVTSDSKNVTRAQEAISKTIERFMGKKKNYWFSLNQNSSILKFGIDGKNISVQQVTILA
jgi:hypothetical protein